MVDKPSGMRTTESVQALATDTLAGFIQRG
jgi:hypothetical protein